MKRRIAIIGNEPDARKAAQILQSPPNPDLAAWAAGLLSDAELEQRTGLSPAQAQYTDDARAVWFADPMPPDSMCPHCGNSGISEDEAGPDWWHCDTCGYKAHEDEFYPAD